MSSTVACLGLWPLLMGCAASYIAIMLMTSRVSSTTSVDNVYANLTLLPNCTEAPIWIREILFLHNNFFRLGIICPDLQGFEWDAGCSLQVQSISVYTMVFNKHRSRDLLVSVKEARMSQNESVRITCCAIMDGTSMFEGNCALLCRRIVSI